MDIYGGGRQSTSVPAGSMPGTSATNASPAASNFSTTGFSNPSTSYGSALPAGTIGAVNAVNMDEYNQNIATPNMIDTYTASSPQQSGALIPAAERDSRAMLEALEQQTVNAPLTPGRSEASQLMFDPEMPSTMTAPTYSSNAFNASPTSLGAFAQNNPQFSVPDMLPEINVTADRLTDMVSPADKAATAIQDPEVLAAERDAQQQALQDARDAELGLSGLSPGSLAQSTAAAQAAQDALSLSTDPETGLTGQSAAAQAAQAEAMQAAAAQSAYDSDIAAAQAEDDANDGDDGDDGGDGDDGSDGGSDGGGEGGGGGDAEKRGGRIVEHALKKVRRYAIGGGVDDDPLVQQALDATAPRDEATYGSVMRPFEPSWRDKIGAYLFDQTSGSPVSRRAVEGLVGSTGLGNTGLSVADVVPGGQVLAAQEALREGDYKGAAMAVMPIPGASKLGPLARSAAPIKAYHGSPHDFDKFDLSKIGTGEGAQAYGHGLYFAEHEPTAKFYRDTLSPNQAINDLPGYSQGAAQLIRNKGDIGEQMFRQHYADLGPEKVEQAIAEAKAAIANPPTGHMYEVGIHADPEHLLNWDKQLKEQPENVVRSLQERGLINMSENVGPSSAGVIRPLGWTEDVGRLSGEKLYRRLSENQLAGFDRKGAEALASKELNSAGIPGIKYLDQGSRAAGDGSRNYVVFDDRIISIAKKYGIPLAAASAIFEASNPRPAMASEAPVDRALTLTRGR